MFFAEVGILKGYPNVADKKKTRSGLDRPQTVITLATKGGGEQMATTALAKVTALDRYMAEISRYPLLTQEEETEQLPYPEKPHAGPREPLQ